MFDKVQDVFDYGQLIINLIEKMPRHFNVGAFLINLTA